jgi:NADH-quinone oxidoreductase subunit M
MNLTLLILIPLLTAVLILLAKGLQQIRVIGLAGAVAQLGLAGWLLKSFLAARATGNNATYLFESNQTWFKALNINYHIGIDGIALAMILLTSVIVVAGILVSWTMDKLSKEYFFLLVLLSMGAYGFFRPIYIILFLRSGGDP